MIFAFLLSLFWCVFRAQSASRRRVYVESVMIFGRLVEVDPFLFCGDELFTVNNLFKDDPLKRVGTILVPCLLKIAILMFVGVKSIFVAMPSIHDVDGATNINTGCRGVENSVDASNFLTWRVWYTFQCLFLSYRSSPRLWWLLPRRGIVLSYYSRVCLFCIG